MASFEGTRRGLVQDLPNVLQFGNARQFRNTYLMTNVRQYNPSISSRPRRFRRKSLAPRTHLFQEIIADIDPVNIVLVKDSQQSFKMHAMLRNTVKRQIVSASHLIVNSV